MNKFDAKRWQKEINYWLDGGDLWYFDDVSGWLLRTGNLAFTQTSDTSYVIGDSHLKARQADALGEPVQFKSPGKWLDVKDKPSWHQNDTYRPKPKEWYDNIPKDGILCWVWDSEGVPVKRSVWIVRKADHSQPIPFEAVTGATWRYARPVKPEECYRQEED